MKKPSSEKEISKKLAGLSDAEIGTMLRRSRAIKHGPRRKKSRHQQRWGVDEERLLSKFSDREVSRRLGRSIHSVQRRRLSLGIRRRSHVPWTEQEDRVLIEAGLKTTIPVLAKKLRRSVAAVQMRRNKILGPKFIKRAWTKDQIRLLGKKQDQEVAALTGRTRAAVTYQRMALNIPATISRRSWSRREDKMLRTKPDPIIAKQLGRSVRAVRIRRRLLGIPGPPVPPRWLPEHDALIGTQTDRVIAALIGHSASAVTSRRKRLGRPPAPPMFKPWKPQEDALLGTMPDGKLAKLLGRTRAAVQVHRHALGIPGLRNDGGKVWTTEEIRLLGTMPDADLARQLGRSKMSIELKRQRKGVRPF